MGTGTEMEAAMEMDTPIGPNVLDAQADGVVGKPLDRVDWRAKVTGGAHYAFEFTQGPETAYGFVVEASIGKGTIRSIDTGAAEMAPGYCSCLRILMRPSKARAITVRPARSSSGRR